MGTRMRLGVSTESCCLVSEDAFLIDLKLGFRVRWFFFVCRLHIIALGHDGSSFFLCALLVGLLL